MILMYHKVSDEAKTMWWVSANTFNKQMAQLSGKEVVYLDDYDPNNKNHVVITFDGIYTDVLKYAVPILEKYGYPYELFITSEWLGKDSSFDAGEPLAYFTNDKQLKEMVERGGRVQWHTRTHCDLSEVSEEQAEEELMIPKELLSIDKKGFRWFAYPYGKSTKHTKKIVKDNFTGGLGTDKGSFDDAALWPRVTVTEEMDLSDNKVTVAVMSYNYADYLVEAVESVLSQTYLPDEIILSDDNSTDHTLLIMNAYKEKYPDLITVNSNKKNMGIVGHFSKVAKMAKGTYMCFLGADNRLPSNYVESLYTSLETDATRAIAYTDFYLFGGNAQRVYEGFYEKYKDGKIADDIYKINFPDFTDKSRTLLLSGERNFIHGSSMYRLDAYKSVGGYKSRDHGPEDFTLFQAMVKADYGAIKSSATFLEYRQHSEEQANHQATMHSELVLLRDRIKDQDIVLEKSEELRAENEKMHKEIDKLTKDFKEIEDAYKQTSARLDRVESNIVYRVARKVRNIVKR